MDIKGIIFDLDGTLLDSMHCWENVDRSFLLENGVTPPEHEKPKKKGLFRSLKNSIHSFLEEDDDDDLMPIPDQKNSEELQFGKAYNVKKDR